MRLTLGVLLACTVVCGCGPKTLQTRMSESETRAGKADDALTRAERALAALEPEEAQRQLDAAKKLLDHPDAPLYPEYELMRGRLDEGVAALPQCRLDRDKKRLTAKVGAARERGQKAGDAVQSTKVTEADIKACRQAVDELRSALAEGKELESKAEDYAAFAKEQRAWADGLEPALAVAPAKVEFMAGPLAAANEGSEKLRAAKKATAVEERRELYTAARDRLRECSDKGKALVAKTPALGSAAVSADGAVASIEGVLSDCSTGVSAAEKALKALPKPKPPPKAPKKTKKTKK